MRFLKNALIAAGLFAAALCAAAPVQAVTLFSPVQGDLQFPGLTPAPSGGQLAIDNSAIGATTPAPGSFTALSAASVKFTGSAPVPTGTGTPTIAAGSTDNAGEVTAGSSATSVVITFAGTHANAPFCVVRSQAQITSFAYTLSTTAITITQTATSANLIDYVCVQH